MAIKVSFILNQRFQMKLKKNVHYITLNLVLKIKHNHKITYTLNVVFSN